MLLPNPSDFSLIYVVDYNSTGAGELILVKSGSVVDISDVSNAMS